MDHVIIFGKPVPVKIVKGESLFFAENESLHVYATGKTKESAIQAFARDVRHFWRHYKELGWDQVTGGA